jgi:hypothetical protein
MTAIVMSDLVQKTRTERPAADAQAKNAKP